MNRLALILLSTILVALLSISAILLYAFSEHGNATVKNYIQKDLEEKLSLPVDVREFTLEAGKSTLLLRINEQVDVEAVIHYAVLTQSFTGIYRIQAKNFNYENMVLRQLDVEGHFKGRADDIVVDGKGTALDAVLTYRFSLLKNIPKKIEAVMQGIGVEELLVLFGQPPLLKGKIDVDINMPDIGDEFADGYGHIVLHKALFDGSLVKEMYDLDVPKESYVLGNIDMKLRGNSLDIAAKAKSNLFTLSVDEAKVELKDKNVSVHYAIDVKEMGILTQNKLSGALKILGKFEGADKTYRAEGMTHSLGGTLRFDITEHSKVSFENLDLEKIQLLTRQPLLLKGLLSGSADVDKEFQSGRYDVQIQKGKVNAKIVEKEFGYKVPSVNHFTLSSKGKIVKSVLDAEGTVKSNLSDVKLRDIKYRFKKKELQANYDVFLPNLGLLIPNNKAIKRGYLHVKGELELDKILKVKGEAKGLGEALTFVYDGKGLKIDAENLFIEKLLSLSNLPRYVKGKLSAQVNISDIEGKSGTFYFKANHLETQPNPMERLMGKKLSIPLEFTSKGDMKKGVATLSAKIQTSMGNLYLEDMIIDSKSENLKSSYRLDIPSLEKTYALTGTKLYGPMILLGNLSKEKVLKVRGNTSSIGGNIDYTLIAESFYSKINKVPVENILALLGHDKLVEGDAYGSVKYDIKKKVGTIDIDIKSFQIKSSSTTKTVKMFIGKDPARIIYNSTKLHANIDADIISYTLTAKGSHSSIEVREGRLDKARDTHRAKFKFVYEKYVVTGSIGGTIDKPRIIVDPASIMQSKTGEKIQEKLDKALGGDMGKAVGGFLKGFTF